jgi:hypothetical protein
MEREIKAKNFLSEMLWNQSGKCYRCHKQLWRYDIKIYIIKNNRVFCGGCEA